MRKILIIVAGLVGAAFASAPASAQSASTDEIDDPYLWLEEVEGERALDWVREQNERSLKELVEGDADFAALEAEALEILTAEGRLPLGEIHNGAVYNFWQDETNVRGLWRRASVESYVGGAPEWEALIDYDALARQENENWVRGDVVCLKPQYRHCMVKLSRGGSDAGIWREFDAETKGFVEGGFLIPEAKSNVAWFDEDMIIVGTDMGEGTLTASGYARTLRAWSRGGTLADAPVIFEGAPDDVSVSASVYRDGDKTHIFVNRAKTFFEYERIHAEGEGAPTTLPIPPNANLYGVLGGRAIILLRENWIYGAGGFPMGTVVAYDLETGEARLIYAATAAQSIESVGVGENSVVIQYLDNVIGRAVRVRPNDDGSWRAEDIPMPDDGVVSLVSTGGEADDALLSYESLTTPNTLFYVTPENNVRKVFDAPALYDASDVVVEQRFAKSADGRDIPYFVMAKGEVLAAGDAPTVQFAYGGFLAAQLPRYYADPGRPQHGALAGRMWVSRGGVLAIANIRGGSEFGPRWHQAALKEKRQRAFDDFIAVSEDLIKKGVTSPGKLGAVGRSNGGLLMGAVMTQRPDLYAAVDIGVPLFDMKRYHKLLAGASWIAEYGDPDKAEDWAYISAYSPYQLLEGGKDYPKALFYTSTKDDRVHPGHARKAAAKLADLGYDFFYYENIEGGHGGTANQEQLAYRTALEYAYFMRMLMNDAAAGEGSSGSSQPN